MDHSRSRSTPIDHLDPHLWGKSAWDWIDALVLTYPTENPTIEVRNAYLRFFTDLTILLPCPTCRAHHVEFLRSCPIDDNVLRSRDALLEFCFRMKNHARRSEGRDPIPSIETMWDDMAARYHIGTATATATATGRPQAPSMFSTNASLPIHRESVHTTNRFRPAAIPQQAPAAIMTPTLSSRARSRRTGCACGNNRVR